MHNYSVIWGYAGRIIVRYVNFYRVLALRGICKIFVRRILCFANVKLCDILKKSQRGQMKRFLSGRIIGLLFWQKVFLIL